MLAALVNASHSVSLFPPPRRPQASIVAALDSDFAKVQALVEEAVRHLSARPGTGSTVRLYPVLVVRVGTALELLRGRTVQFDLTSLQPWSANLCSYDATPPHKNSSL